MNLAPRVREVLRRSPVAAPLRHVLERLTSLIVLLQAGAFDPAWYQLQRTGTDRVRGGTVGVRVLAVHYVLRGRRAGLSPHPFFEAEWAFPADWRRSGPDPAARLLRGRPRYPISAHPLCDAQAWLDAHPEAAGHRWGWFGHFLATVAGAPGTVLPLPSWAARSTVPGLTAAGARALLADRVRDRRAGAGPGTDPAGSDPVDWSALVADLPGRRADLLSVLVVAPDWGGAWNTARSVLDDAADDPETGVDVADDPETGVDVADDPETGDGPGGVEIVLVDDAASRGSSVVLSCLPLLDSRVRVRRTPVRVHRARATNLALADSRGREVAVIEAGTELWPGWRVAREALAPGVLAAPVVAAGDGTVASAGGVFTGRHRLPADLFAGFAADEAAALGPVVTVDTPPVQAALITAADLIDVRGLDERYVNGWELPDLALRLRQRGTGAGRGTPEVRVHTASRAWQPLAPPATAAQDAANRRAFASRWTGDGNGYPGRADQAGQADRAGQAGTTGHDGPTGLPGRAAALWERAGFEVQRWESGAQGTAGPGGGVRAAGAGGAARRAGGAPTVPVAVLARRGPARVRLPDGREVPRLRWAVKIAAPTSRVSLRWGDVHFAEAVVGALRRLGQQVVIDHRDAFLRDSGRFDDVVLTIRGLYPVPERGDAPGQVRLLWVISHPELVDAEEVATYDRAFVASLTWGQGAAEAAAPVGQGAAGAAAPVGQGAAGAAAPVLCDRYGGPVRPLLQATDPSRFHPGAAEPDTGEPVLFVGNSRGVFRPVIRALVDAGIEVGIYGAQWSPFLGAGAVRAELVSNAKVPALYRAAGVVLNDHWEEMRAHGFVSNRLFDAAACGARVVSDEVAGAEELFGGLVRSYRDEAELVRLVRAGAGEFPGPQARVDLARRVAREHSFDARAVQLLEAALEVKSHTEVD